MSKKRTRRRADITREMVRPNENRLEPLLSIEEARAILRLSRATIWRRIAAGELPVVRITGRTLIERDALRAFIAARRPRRGGPP